MDQLHLTSTSKLKAAVIGAGKFGKFHAAKYAAMRDVQLVGVVDQSLEAAAKVAHVHGCKAFSSVKEIIGKVDLISIATPAVTHCDLAVQCLEAGIQVYVEKPIACTLEEADIILAAAKRNNCIVAVGHQERHILNRLHLDVDDVPRAIECHRLNSWSGRATDVDVALDLMIHDIDLVLQLARGPVDIKSSSAHDGQSSSHDISAELTVGNCIARLSASRRAERQQRSMRIEYLNGSVFIDFINCIIEDTRPITLRASYSDLISGADGVVYDPLGLALTEFVQCVRSSEAPFVSGSDGRRALAVALDILPQPQLAVPATPPPFSSSPISLFDLETPARRLRSDIDQRVARVLEHRQYIGAPEVSALEDELATYTGTKYRLTCSSGTVALTIALMAEGLNRDDAVFLPAFTYNATCNAVITAGATPVFVDVDQQTCNICPIDLERAVARVSKEGRVRPAMIIAVDLYGAPADYKALVGIAKAYNMLILADAAQSFGGGQHGSMVGGLADMTATSFYPSKTLGGFGDGGALFTNDTERFERWKSVRWHGTDDTRAESIRVGMNGRLDSIQCAILLSKMGIFAEEMLGRKRVAKWYRELLPSRYLTVSDPATHANGLFTVVLSSPDQRNIVQALLKDSWIATGVYYAKPLHRHSAFKKYLLPDQKLGNSEWLAERVLSLPMSPYLRKIQVQHVVEAFKRAVVDAGRLGEAKAML